MKWQLFVVIERKLCWLLKKKIENNYMEVTYIKLPVWMFPQNLHVRKMIKVWNRLLLKSY
uniref:Uncharacterized protein n=1 Tax=Helianthus annuus TaxID=4232 RepID=A0A251UUS0_HELAN